MYLPRNPVMQNLEKDWDQLQSQVLEKSYHLPGEIGKKVQSFVNSIRDEYNFSLHENYSQNRIPILDNAVQTFRTVSEHLDQLKKMDEKTQNLFFDTHISWDTSPFERWGQRTAKFLDLIKKNNGFSVQNAKELEDLIDEGVAKGFIHQKVFYLGKTEFFIALAKRENCEGVFKFFYDKGINISSNEDIFGNTALIWAIANACNGNAREILKIWKRGAYLNDVGILGNTALHLAVGKGYKNISADRQRLACSNFDLVHDLIHLGCDVNIQNVNGDTPLHFACLRRDIQMILALLDAGANKRLRNKEGKRPQDFINFSHVESEIFLKKNVSFFLLDEKERDANLEVVRDLFP